MATEMIFKFKDAARFRPGFNREAAAARLAQILERDGALEVDAIVDDGLREDSPLHPQFAFSADEALQDAYRREAEYLRRTFVTVIVTPAGDQREVRAVLPVLVQPDDEGRRFISSVRALSDDEYRHQILETALAELVALRRKYAELEELARVFAAIDRAAKRLAA